MVDNMVSLGAEFSVLSTGNVADAAKDLVRVMDSGIQALDVSMKLFGFAYPVECSGGNNLAIIQAVSMAPAGSVLIVNVQGNLQAGHVGDVLSKAAQLRGVAGFVVDGSCRDVDEVIKIHFPVFARGSNPKGALKLKNGKINQATECGGVTVHPGDLIFGDASGVLVFSPADKAVIIEKAKQVAMREIDVIKQLRQGKTVIDALGLDGID